MGDTRKKCRLLLKAGCTPKTKANKDKTMQLYDIPEYFLDELYDYYNRTIDLAASYDWAVHPRTQFHVQSALRDYRKFADGELDIDLGTKRWFRVMSHLVEEVGDLDNNQTALVLALAEIGHAAAHLGHLNTALSRGGRTEADVKYEELNRAYVGFGFKCAETYLNLIQKH